MQFAGPQAAGFQAVRQGQLAEAFFAPGNTPHQYREPGKQSQQQYAKGRGPRNLDNQELC